MLAGGGGGAAASLEDAAHSRRPWQAANLFQIAVQTEGMLLVLAAATPSFLT